MTSLTKLARRGLLLIGSLLGVFALTGIRANVSDLDIKNLAVDAEKIIKDVAQPIPHVYADHDSGCGGDWEGSCADSSSGGDGDSGSSSGCFVAGTQILLADGSSKSIESITVGDVIMAFEALGALHPAQVDEVIVRQDKKVISIDGLRVTEEHPFLMQNGSWKDAKEIAVGDKVVLGNGDLRDVKQVDDVPGLHTVYNFTVNKFNTYVAGGIRVHNES